MGPFGGSAAVIQVDANKPGTVVAATNNGLLFRSRNGGDLWQPLPFPPQLRCTLHAFAITSGTYYAGISADTSETSGLYRSSNEGATWEQVAGLRNKEVWSLAVWHENGEVMAAGTRDGVYLSIDSGQNWKHISPAGNEELAPVVSLAFDPKHSETIYAGTPHLPWKTSDGGANWHPIHDGMLDDSDVFSINVDSADPERVFASACSGIYRSDNAAGSWKKMKGAADASYRTYIIRQNPSNRNLVYAGTTFGLQRSTDGGVDWRRVTPEGTRWIAFDISSPERLYIATDGAGLLRSDDAGETFTAINNGFCNRQLPAFTSTADTAIAASIFERSHGGVYELKADGREWVLTAGPSDVPAQLLRLESASGAGHVELFATGYTSMLISGDLGHKWTAVPEPAKGAKVTSFLGVGTEDSGRFAATDAGLFRWTYGAAKTAAKWTRVEGPVGAHPIRLLASLGKLGLAAVTPAGVFVSEDGSRWKTTAPLPVAAPINNIAPAGGRSLIAGTSSGLIRSDDFGASWEPVTWGLGTSSVSAVCQHPLRSGTVFAAQYGMVYQSDDAGKNWRPVSPGRKDSFIQIEVIKALAVLPGSPDRLLALTQSQGTFALPLLAFSEGKIHSASLTGSTENSNTVR